jgi:hypothetical protein
MRGRRGGPEVKRRECLDGWARGSSIEAWAIPLPESLAWWDLEMGLSMLLSRAHERPRERAPRSWVGRVLEKKVSKEVARRAYRGDEQPPWLLLCSSPSSVIARLETCWGSIGCSRHCEEASQGRLWS